jgi:predicted dehydrogenase
MAPIRVGLIGLTSGTGEQTASPVSLLEGARKASSLILGFKGGGWAAGAHLPYLLASPHYEIVALCNSSVESAKIAVKKYDLPASTKTYGSAEDLANDPDVDLVVVNVRVDRHYKLTKPALEKGKDVFVEWPIGANLQEAEELTVLAKKSGSKTIVGLQGRMSPQVQKVRELVGDGKIGRLLSTNITADCGGMSADTEPPGVDYMAKKAVGGNVLTIITGHMLDNTLYALGELKEFSSVLATRWPKTRLTNSDGTPGELIDRETPDHVLIQGILAESGATLSVNLRGGKSFPGTPLLVWRIFGTKGEIRVSSYGGFLGIVTGTEKVELYDNEKDEIKVIECPFPEAVKDITNLSKITGLDYEAFATGNKEGLVTFEDGLVRHRFIDEIWKSAEEKKTKEYLQ